MTYLTKAKILFSFLVAITALVGCTSKEEKLKTEAIQVYNESMKIHDEVMPRMDEMYSLKQKLKARRDSLLLDSAGNTQKLIVVNEKITALDLASKDMMDWMHHVQDVPGNEKSAGHQHSTKHDEATATNLDDILKIQQEQKSKIEVVKRAMETSIKEAKDYLNNNHLKK